MSYSLNSLFNNEHPLNSGQIGAVKSVREVVRKCCRNKLRLKIRGEVAPSHNTHKVDYVDLDPRVDSLEEKLT